LKHRFLDLSENAFYSGHKAEKEFEWPDDSLEHGLLDNPQEEFWPGDDRNSFPRSTKPHFLPSGNTKCYLGLEI
jgi:hypothetical protein